MRFGIYTVYDCKSEEFCAPFIQREGAVERTVKDIVSKSPVPPEDLSLFKIGIWDSEEGVISDGLEKDPSSDGLFLCPIFVPVDFLGSCPSLDSEVDK